MCPTFRPDAFPLLFGPRSPASHHVAALIDAPAGAVAAEYARLSLCAPRRGRPFFSDRRTGATPRPSSGRREERLAMALFNARTAWELGGEGGFRLLDYQTPLMARRADAKVGKVDLLGLGTAGRLVVGELKIEGRSSIPGPAPLLALVQALRYAAILEGNRGTLAAEVEKRFERQVAACPPVLLLLLLLLGTRAWWDGHLAVARERSWRPAFTRLLGERERIAGITVWCAAISGPDLWPGLQAERPTFSSPPAVDLLELGSPAP